MSEEIDSYGITPDEPDRTRSASAMLDRLCWMVAQNADDAHPPDEVAEERIESLDSDPDLDITDEDRAEIRSRIRTVFLENAELFQDIYQRGFDPVARVKRDTCRFIDHYHADDPDPAEIHDTWRVLMPDWEWWDEYRRSRIGMEDL